MHVAAATPEGRCVDAEGQEAHWRPVGLTPWRLCRKPTESARFSSYQRSVSEDSSCSFLNNFFNQHRRMQKKWKQPFPHSVPRHLPPKTWGFHGSWRVSKGWRTLCKYMQIAYLLICIFRSYVSRPAPSNRNVMPVTRVILSFLLATLEKGNT